MKFLHLLFPALLFSLLPAQDPLSGSQVQNAINGSLDIISSHVTLLQAQSRYDKMLSNLSVTDNQAPVSILMNDGSVESVRLERLLMNICLGLGKVSSFGLYAGAQWDAARVNGSIPALEDCNASQTLGYVGMAIKGFHIDAGIMSSRSLIPLDTNREFASNPSQWPPEDTGYSSKMSLYTLYHKSGVYAAFATATEHMDGMSETKLREFKFSIQPLRRFFPDPAGLPFVGLIGYTPASSYYSRYKEFYKQELSPEDSSDEKKDYDFTLGSDDIMKLGFRSSATFKITKPRSLRKLEAAYTYATESKAQVVAARTQLFFNDGTPNLAIEAFALASIFKRRLTFALSYSYNSPDNSTFLPLPKLHVFGLQAILGRRETAKAIIPYAAKILADEGDYYTGN